MRVIMRVIETHEYRIPSVLLPALINNEPVRDEIDRKCIERFVNTLERYKKEYNATDYVVEYSDIGCNVTDIKILFLR